MSRGREPTRASEVAPAAPRCGHQRFGPRAIGALLAGAFIASASCGGAAASAARTDSKTVVADGQQADSSAVASGKAGPFELTVQAPSRIHTGESVRMKIRLTNVAEETLRVQIPGHPTATAFDVLVSRTPDGPPIWRRLEGQVIPLSATLGPPMAPGAAVEFSTNWDQRAQEGAPVPPGTYYVSARFARVTAYRSDHTLYWRGPVSTAIVRMDVMP